jgi:tRNA threonylcarbamoyladenosine modification (KEOPS) complex  Pcc1 subunit
MIRAKMTFEGRHAEEIGQAVLPDNLPEMVMKTEERTLTIEFCAQKIGTMLATLNDLLMNLKVAEEIVICAED